MAGMGDRRGALKDFGGETEERGHLGDLGVDRRIKLNWIFTDYIDMAQDRDRWWALVNSVINFRVP